MSQDPPKYNETPNAEGGEQVDESLFRESMQDVIPLQEKNQAKLDHKRPAAIPHQFIEDEQKVLEDMFSDEYVDAALQPGDILSFRRSGVQHRVFQKLKRGDYRINYELDLHGFTAKQARQALAEFLTEVSPGGGECVRIVHGKGRRSDARGPVLKGKVNTWLRHYDRVLAFHSARPVDGGTGAVYVLLKRDS